MKHLILTLATILTTSLTAQLEVYNDFDGASEELGIVAVECGDKGKTIIGIYNLQGQEVTMDSTGIKIIRYSDHTIKKVQ